MAGTRSSEIRRALEQQLVDAGWSPVSGGFHRLGRDKRAKHRTFATHSPTRTYVGRQGGADVHTTTTVEIRALLSTRHEQVDGGTDGTEDAAEDLVSELLLGAQRLTVQTMSIAPHASIDRIRVVTVRVTVFHQAYTADPVT